MGILLVLCRIRQGQETPAEQVTIQREGKPLILLLQPGLQLALTCSEADRFAFRAQSVSMGVRLTPAGHLRWESEPAAEEPAAELAPVLDAFRTDWRGALFTLAAEKLPAQEIPSLRYWQQLAEHYLTGLCHLPADAEKVAVEPPGDALLATWVLNAPPMEGGEYLSAERLQRLWEQLDEWVREAATAAGGPAALLQARAPRWRQVGRVCFHLAENKNDTERPFAFLATFSSGFGAGGRLKHLPLRSALQQYAGANNRAALINLLSPVEEAAKACDWVRELADTGDLYRPLAWSSEHAYRFLRGVPELERSGLSVRVPNWWRKRPRPQVSVTIGSQTPPRVGADAVLDFKVEVALGDSPLSAEELEALRSAGDGLVLLRNQWVEVDRERLGQAIAHWETLQRNADGDGISFIEGMRLLAGASADLRQEDLTESDRPWVQVTAGAALRKLLSRLRRPDTLEQRELVAAEALRGTLRPYQREGLAWLHFVTGLGLGACLADDMGLGKTIQVLALLLCGRDAGEGQRAPALLVVPASLLGNWRAEAERFAPALKLCFLHPAETDRQTLDEIAAAPAEHLAAADLAVTTYTMLVRQTWLAEIHWRLVILDEAQAIRNPATRQSRAARKLAADARIALTGTPVENRLGDLWALFDFLNPGLLGSRTVFGTFVKTPAGAAGAALRAVAAAGEPLHPAPPEDRPQHHRRPAREDRDQPLLPPDPGAGQALPAGGAGVAARPGVQRRHRAPRIGARRTAASQAGLQPSQSALR